MKTKTTKNLYLEQFRLFLADMSGFFLILYINYIKKNCFDWVFIVNKFKNLIGILLETSQ